MNCSIPHTFMYNNRLYLRAVPVKRLLQSTMVYEVTVRGDIFAVDVVTGELTVLPGTAVVVAGVAEFIFTPVKVEAKED